MPKDLTISLFRCAKIIPVRIHEFVRCAKIKGARIVRAKTRGTQKLMVLR